MAPVTKHGVIIAKKQEPIIFASIFHCPYKVKSSLLRSFIEDFHPKQNLFFRSDNASLAELGVPAHTISTSKMDTEKFYHTLDDEIETLDMNNMAEIIKAIAISSKTIVSGRDTPTRVEKSE